MLRIAEGNCGDTALRLWFVADDESYTLVQNVRPGDCVAVPRWRAKWHRTYCPETGLWSDFASENPEGQCG